MDQWEQEITPHTLSVASKQLSSHLEVLTPSEIRYSQIVRQDPSAAEKLDRWFVSQNKLVKDGDEGYQNQTALLLELRGRDVNSTTIMQALGRAGFRTGLHYVPPPCSVDPRQHADDGNPFMPKEKIGPLLEYRGGRKNHAADPASYERKPEATPLSKSDEQWKSMALNLTHDGSHSQQEATRKIYDREVGARKSWRQVYEACAKYVREVRNRSFVR